MSEHSRSDSPERSRSDSAKIHVVVVGLMGVGKTTFGQALARSINVDYIDSDTDIARLFGLSGAEVANRHGVPELHRIEAAVLLGALARPTSAVITAAASIVEDDLVRELVARRAYVVWLETDLDEVLIRQGQDGHRRPMDRNELAALADRRAPLFESMADHKLTADRDPEELVAAVLPNITALPIPTSA